MQEDEKPKVWTPDPSMIRKAGDPEPVSEADLRDLERLAGEHRAIQDLRLAVIDAWNRLEDGMTEVLRVAACMPDPVAASILYFSPYSFSTRQQMVDRLVEHLVVHGAKDPNLLAEWKKISEKLKTPKGARDLAAHGSVVSHHQDGENHVRLTPSLGQLHSHLKSYRDGKLPGKGRLDLTQAIEAIETRITLLQEFATKLRLA